MAQIKTILKMNTHLKFANMSRLEMLYACVLTNFFIKNNFKIYVNDKLSNKQAKPPWQQDYKYSCNRTEYTLTHSHTSVRRKGCETAWAYTWSRAALL